MTDSYSGHRDRALETILSKNNDMIELFYDIELGRLNRHLHYQIDRYFADGYGTDKSFNQFYEPYVLVPYHRVVKDAKCHILGCHKNRGKGTRYCWMHKSRRFKQINPLIYVWIKLKYNAKNAE